MKPHLLAAAIAFALAAQPSRADPPATAPAARVETVERLLQSGGEDDALRAFATLQALGPDGAAALPAVVRYLADEAHAETINRSGLMMGGTVLQVGPGAVPPLVGLLKDEDVRVRGTAAMFLTNFGRFSPESRAEMLKALPQLTAALGDPAAGGGGRLGRGRAVRGGVAGRELQPMAEGGFSGESPHGTGVPPRFSRLRLRKSADQRRSVFLRSRERPSRVSAVAWASRP